MVKNIYLLLGLPEGAPWSEVKVAYAKFMESLCSADSAECEEPAGQHYIQEARRNLSEAWEHMRSPDVCGVYDEPQTAGTTATEKPQSDFTRPKLGQLLVAGGLLTLDQLDSMLEIQRNTKTEHVQLGALLVHAGYLTEQQLSYYLRMQAVLKLPSEHPQRWGQRLLELGLVTDDQLKVALIEQQTTGSTLREAFINRGWLTAETLDRIF